MVSLSVGLLASSINGYAVWVVDLGGPKEPHTRGGLDPPQQKNNFVEFMLHGKALRVYCRAACERDHSVINNGTDEQHAANLTHSTVNNGISARHDGMSARHDGMSAIHIALNSSP